MAVLWERRGEPADDKATDGGRCRTAICRYLPLDARLRSTDTSRNLVLWQKVRGAFPEAVDAILD